MSRTQFATEFAGRTIGWAEEALELTREELGQVVGANRKTILRWVEGESTPSPEHRRALEQINQLRYLLEDSFRTISHAQRWLHTPVPGLRGQTPFFALTNGDIEGVLKLLASLHAGAFR